MRTKIGVVKSAKMQKTVKARVEQLVTHARYLKKYKKSKLFLADIGSVEVKEGDRVEIAETKPMSKRKHWTVTKILS